MLRSSSDRDINALATLTFSLSSLWTLFSMTTLSKTKLFRTVNSNQMVSLDDASFFFFVQLGIVTKPGSDQTWLAPLLSRNNKKRYSTIQRGTASFSSIRVDDCTTKKQYQHNFLRVSLNLLILVHTPIFALPKNTILSLIKILSLFSSSSF